MKINVVFGRLPPHGPVLGPVGPHWPHLEAFLGVTFGSFWGQKTKKIFVQNQSKMVGNDVKTS